MLDTLARRSTSSSSSARCDPEIDARIAQYEMAFRMQTSVPEADRPVRRARQHVFELYGPDARKPGTFAANCLLARRLAERGVRFIQLYHQGWDQHGGLPEDIRDAVPKTRPAVGGAGHGPEAARPARRHARHLGRRVRPHHLLARASSTADDYGRDHHPRCFTIWLAGGGVKRGITYGETDDFGYNIVERSRSTSTTCTRRCCTCWASTTSG